MKYLFSASTFLIVCYTVSTVWTYVKNRKNDEFNSDTEEHAFMCFLAVLFTAWVLWRREYLQLIATLMVDCMLLLKYLHSRRLSKRLKQKEEKEDEPTEED